MIALYCRVSTDEQVHGFSIDSQKERLEAYCKSQGWEDYLFFIDDGYSGTNMERPALKRMIRYIEAGRISTVLVYKLDRLGRKQKDVLFLLEDIFDTAGVAFKSATEPFDTSTPLGKAMLGILAVFAQLERDTIIERVTAGRQQRLRRGLWAGGRVPFGYRWDQEKQELIIVPEQAELVRKAFKMYLKGHSRLYIAEWFAKRTNDRVSDHNTIRDMLKRTTYIGKLNNNGVLVDGNHEPIIDIETFERVQKEMKKRREGRAPMGNYFLSGLMRCGLCGSQVIHIWGYDRGVKKYHYYACKDQHVRPKGKENYCKLGYIQMEKLDAQVAEQLKKLAVNPADVVKKIRENTGHIDQLEIIESLESELVKVDEKLERWYDAFEQGLLDPDQLKKRIDSLENEKKAILTQLSEVNEPKKDNTEDLIKTLKKIGETWDDLTFDEQKSILRAAVDHIIVHPKGEFEIAWNV